MKIRIKFKPVKRILGGLTLIVLIAFMFFFYSVTTVEDPGAVDSTIVNDVTRLNPVCIASVYRPTSIEEIIQQVKNHDGPISIGGGRYSMGGQTATEQALHLDMRGFNKVLRFSKEKKEITVQPGIRWRQLQEYLDPYNLSVKIMQTYSNFTVGGSLSVNVHGRYIGLGPVIFSVKSIKMVLPDGTLITASPTENADIFYAAIGGYGALGVIVEATLSLADNDKVARKSEVMSIKKYKDFFLKKIREDSNVVFHNADIYPNEYNEVRAVSYVKTDKPITITDRLQSKDKSYRVERFGMWMVSEMPGGKWFRQHCMDPVHYLGEEVKWRNYEASYDVNELEPASRKGSTYVLQEYFVPVQNFDVFVPKMAEILNRHEVNVINVSIRHAKKDPGSLMAWARNEVFAFVIYYKQGTAEYQNKAVGIWTRELISAAVSAGGAYYLPYQIHATGPQFRAAYPSSEQFFALKRKLDPTNKFRNKLLDAYHTAGIKDTIMNNKDTLHYTSKFKAVFSDKGKSDSIFLFLQNVYGLYPPDKFHSLVSKLTAKYETDKEIYENIQNQLPEVTPALWSFRYALPALSVQKKEITAQTVKLLGSQKKVNGYLEIGTTGRYVNSLEDLLILEGPVYLINDDDPSYGPSDIFERGQLSKIGTFYNLSNYDPIKPEQIADTSLDLVTVYIGLHHAPSEKVKAFVNSIRRVLRPNGKLVIRDHNVQDADFAKFISVVHDVFYSGLGKTWNYTSKEIRNYTSSDSLTKYLEGLGFKTDGQRLLQPNDPSKNTLMIFTKVENDKREERIQGELKKINGYKRDEAQTFLTLPEWYLVYSPDEYAQSLKAKAPSKFPYFGSVKQFWQYYHDVFSITKNKYEFNWGYHFMVMVIGTSYSVENSIKGMYESTMGRISEWFKGNDRTEEDLLAAEVAQEYVDFIRINPWYDFPFYKQFKALWSLNLKGPHTFRKMERRIFLSNEYLLKASYAYLIRLGTKQVYGDADDKIFARISYLPATAFKGKVKLVKQLQDSTCIISLPRYEEFREAVLRLIHEGAKFKEMAGNDEILITCISPSGWNCKDNNARQVIKHPILTGPSKARTGLVVMVKALHDFLPKLKSQGVQVEHLYDY